ncbi:MAG: histidinol-phosphate transaminase [Bacteroidetes bacterium]|jgi:histidinol-phosphate aminotransferase|nr:histidinol-phosphate transaminase [Bacteroidota bacterium]
MFKPETLLARRLKDLQPYRSERERYSGSARPVYFDNGENPYTEPLSGRYYDNTYATLYEQIAALKGVNPNQIIVGVGSDGVIDMSMRAFTEPNESNLIIHTPTFGMYKYYAALNGVAVRAIPMTADYQLDSPAMLDAVDAHTRLLFLCSPNNPTGNALDPRDIELLIRSFAGIVVLDEAYIDFVPERSFVPRLAEFPNLLITHTFSKAWGLAGLRVGIGIGSPELIGLMQRVRPPYNVSSLSVEALLAAIAQPQRMQEQVRRMLANRMRLQEYLQASPLFSRVWPTDTHFVMVESPVADALFAKLFEDGIILRYFERSTELPSRFRISVGTEAENEKLLARLQQYAPTLIAAQP